LGGAEKDEHNHEEIIQSNDYQHFTSKCYFPCSSYIFHHATQNGDEIRANNILLRYSLEVPDS